MLNGIHCPFSSLYFIGYLSCAALGAIRSVFDLVRGSGKIREGFVLVLAVGEKIKTGTCGSANKPYVIFLIFNIKTKK